MLFTMKKGVLVICLCFIMVELSYAQQDPQVWCWIERLGGASWDITNGISIDNQDNIYIAGDFIDKLEGKDKSLTSKGGSDVYVARFTRQGNLDWLWSGGGFGNDKITALRKAPDDDLYISGILEGSMEFGNEQISGDGKKLFVARINKKGNCEWVYTIGYDEMASGYLLNTDKVGNIVMGGVFSGTLSNDSQSIISKGFRDIFLLRLTPQGKLDIFKQYGSILDESLTALSEDSLGNIILTGNNESKLNMDGFTLPAPYTKKYTNCFVTSLDSNLTAQWTKCLYSNSYASVSGVECKADGNIFLTGNFKHAMYVDSLKYSSNGSSDFFVAQLNLLGNVLWMNTYGAKNEERSNALKINKLGGVMVMGSFSDSLSFDSQYIISGGERKDAFVAQWDSIGVVSWAGTLKGSNNNFVNYADLDSEGNLYMTGSFSGSLKADAQQIKSNGEEDVFVAKYLNCPSVENAIDGVCYLCPGGETELSVDKSFSNIIWNDSIKSGVKLKVNTDGVYNVYMIDKNGCVVKDTVTIQNVPDFEFTLGQDTLLLIGNEIELTGPDNFNAYMWQDGTIFQSYRVTNENDVVGIFNYWLTVTDSLSCQWTDSIQVKYYSHSSLSGSDISNISIYPNPVDDVFYWYIDTNTDDTNNIRIEINSLEGYSLYSNSILNYTSNCILSVPVANLNAGTYYFSVIIDGKRNTTKFIKR